MGPAWAEAIAVRGGRVVAAGRADDVAGLAGPGTRRLELRDDEVAIPGLTDAHLHLADAALERSRVDLEGCASIDELVGRVRAAAEAHGAGPPATATPGSKGEGGTRTPSADGPPPTTSIAPLRAGWSRSGPTTTTRWSPAPRRSSRPASTSVAPIPRAA